MEDKRQVKEINASSMADIAFLLLIFFLVATTMNVDTGITRMLPPIPPEEQISEDLKVKERNLLPILVNNNDAIQVMGLPTHISQLTNMVKMFIVNAADDPSMPEKEMTAIAVPDGTTWNYMVSKGVVSLQSTTGASYDVYVQVQNELTRAFNELRDDAARSKFGRAFAELSEGEKEAVQDAVPQAISEAEPRNVGGQ
jgi:biopolymer transport protein ExbD